MNSFHQPIEDHLNDLASLIRQRNKIDQKISQIIGRPAQQGHIGEYIAAKIFSISLEESASNKGIDGVFKYGALAGYTVNIKFYAKRQNLLDINPDAIPDYFLVLSGPKMALTSSRGTAAPLCIESVYLFETREIVPQLKSKIGIATSVPSKFWGQAEIYPQQKNKKLVLTEGQREMLGLFWNND